MGPINSKDKTSAETTNSTALGDNEAYMNDSRVDVEDKEKAQETTNEDSKIGLPEGEVGDCMLGITVVFACANTQQCNLTCILTVTHYEHVTAIYA